MTSPIMTRCLARVELLSRGRGAITLLGPSGAGKSTLALRVHEMSGRTGPLVCINGADLSGDMGAGRMWGWVRGAFSGATKAQEGAFEAAAGGTLFLDEVGDVPLEMQGALLRAIASRVVTRKGEHVERAHTARIITATALDLDDLVRRGLFRRDLACRLSAVGRVHVPGIADRPEDVWPIAQAMAAGWCAIDDSARDVLEAHVWTEGLHELRAVVDAVGEGELLDDSLALAILEPLRSGSELDRVRALPQPVTAPQVAALLGITRRTASRRLGA